MTNSSDGAAEALRVGVIGLGMIGGGVAVSLARSGHPASAVYDVRPTAADGLAGVPQPAASPRAVAENSDVVLLAVVTADQARDALSGADGVLAGARADTIVVLLSTVSLRAVHELAALCADRGVTLLDAGVTGGPAAAKNGLVVMVGGPDASVERARPVLEDFAKLVVHCGTLGAGMVTKLARNLSTYAIWAAVREATSLAVAGGVSAQRLLEVMKGDDTVSPLLHLELLAAGYQIPEDRVASAVALAEKDLAAAQELAGDLGIELPFADLTRPLMRRVYAGELGEPRRSAGSAEAETGSSPHR